MKNDKLLKATILSTNRTFKTAFVATLGFYAGQAVATLIGLSILATSIVVAALIVHFITK